MANVQMTDIGGTGPAPDEFRRSLTSGKLALLVIAAAAPLAAMIGNVPVGMLLGNGAGIPAAFVVGAVLIACVATGYLAMSGQITEAGGFAALVHEGLGGYMGSATAYATGLAYAAGAISLAASFGYFAALIFASFGLHLPWYALSLVAVLIVYSLGRRAANISSRFFVLFMVAEFVILAVVDVSILLKHGLTALPLEVFSAHNVLSGNPGPALMVGLTSFIGIESAILYTRETKNPKRAIPRGTYLSIGVIAVFYVLTAWLFVGSLGVGNVISAAHRHGGNLVLTITAQNAGPVVLSVLELFFCTSMLACYLALHNAATRYVYAIAKSGGLPRALGQIHPVFSSPFRASDSLALLTAAVLIVCALCGAHPYIGISTSLTGVFTIGVIGLQAIVALACIVYFRRRRDPRILRTVVAPAVGGAGISVAVMAMLVNYHVLTSTNSVILDCLPVLLLLAMFFGVAVEHRRRRSELAHIEDVITES